MNKNFIINITSVGDFSKNLKIQSERLEEILDYLTKITNEMDKFFDTPTAHVMQETLLEELKKSKIPCKNLASLSNKVDLFRENYENMYEDTTRSVGGNI